MARSMTGYGFGEYDLYNRKVTVEIKSVNSKYMDLTVKLPRIISLYENDIRNIIKEEVSRGKVDVFLNIISDYSDGISIKTNDDLLGKYFDVFDKICNEYGAQRPTIKDILDIDGVIVKNDNYNDLDALAEIWETLFVALNNAISSFVKTREDEGESLKLDILSKISELELHIEDIKKYSKSISAEYEARLTNKISQTLESLNININDADFRQRIITEVCIFSEKSDVDEEIVRFCVNLENLKNTLISENIIGKKLDFILQELNREVNTLSSKSNDIRLSDSCIAIKVVLEKIREQAKNIE